MLYLAVTKEYYLAHREEIIAKAKAYSEAHPEKRKKIMHKWYKTHKNPNAIPRIPMPQEEAKHRRAVRTRTVNARRRGRINQAPACMICGSVCKTEAHHHNGYSKEAELDVIWVCHPCHLLCDSLLKARKDEIA